MCHTGVSCGAVASGVLQTGGQVWTRQWSEVHGQKKGLFVQE